MRVHNRQIHSLAARRTGTIHCEDLTYGCDTHFGGRRLGGDPQGALRHPCPDPDLEVVATAGDGRIALAKISQMHPDVVTLAVEMPVMNGLETLAELRRLYPKLPIIMFSTLTESGAAATLDALSLSASDYTTNPGKYRQPGGAMEAVRVELIWIKACRKVSWSRTSTQSSVSSCRCDKNWRTTSRGSEPERWLVGRWSATPPLPGSWKGCPSTSQNPAIIAGAATSHRLLDRL
jgi:chemotaxis response regulator CheB